MKVQLQINRQAHTLHSHRVLVTEHTHQSHSSYTQVSNSHFTIDISMSMSSDSKAHSSLLGLMLPFSLYNPVLQLKAVADGHHHHSSVHQNHHRLFSHQILASASLANASASNVALHSALHLPASLHHASLAALRHPHLSPLTNSTSSVHSSSSPSVSPALASPPPALNFPFGHPPSQSHSPKSHHNLHHQGRLKFSIDNILSPTFGGNGLPLVKESLGGALDGDASRSPSSSPTSSISSSKVRLLKSPSQLSTKCTSNATISTPSTSSTTSTNCKATTVSSSGGGPGPHALTRRKYSSDSESSNSSAASTGLSLKKSPKKEPNSSTTNTTSTSASSSSSSSSAAGSVASSSTPGVNGKQAPSSSSSSSSSSSEYYATDESVKDPNKNPSLTFPLDGKDPIVWPAWVYCTRYSDRPSSGEYSSPRSSQFTVHSDTHCHTDCQNGISIATTTALPWCNWLLQLLLPLLLLLCPLLCVCVCDFFSLPSKLPTAKWQIHQLTIANCSLSIANFRWAI